MAATKASVRHDGAKPKPSGKAHLGEGVPALSSVPRQVPGSGRGHFSPFSMMLAVGLSHAVFIMLRYSNGFRVLSLKNVEFCRMFFLHLLR